MVGMVCIFFVALLTHASAQDASGQVSPADFKKLQEQVTLLVQQVQNLQQTNSAYQQKIQNLQQQVGSTKVIAKNAEEKAISAEEKMNQPFDLSAQMAGAATHNFIMAGDAEVQFGQIAGTHSGFTLADFAPVFLYRASDNILFEAGFDIRIGNGSTTLSTGQNVNLDSQTTVNLTFATLDYIVNHYVTLVTGEMLLPLGSYVERSAGWINKIPDDPLVISTLPQTGVGAQLRGALPLDSRGGLFSYAAYVANGPNSVDGSGSSHYTNSSGAVLPNLNLGGNTGIDLNGVQQNINSNPSGGGRLAVFYPFKPHYDIELGLSGQTGPYTGSSQYYSAAVLDAAIHISPYFELKGEYVNTWVQTTDIGTYQPKGFWLQGAYKLAAFNSDLQFINSLELVARYDTLNDGLGTYIQRFTAGYIYHISSSLMFENDYEWLNSQGPNPLPSSSYVFQLSYGF